MVKNQNARKVYAKLGDKGNIVKIIQIITGAEDASGVYDENTRKAVMDYQDYVNHYIKEYSKELRAYGVEELNVTGIADTPTMKCMVKDIMMKVI